MFLKKQKFSGRRILILGSGGIAATALPMLSNHLDVQADQMLVVADEDPYPSVREALGVEFRNVRLTPANYADEIDKLVVAGDLIVNLSGGVSALDLSTHALKRSINYVDTSNERWEHGSTYNDSADFSQQWNLLIGQRNRLPRGSTALVSHGANPGLVSHFAKQAIEDLARRERIWDGNGDPDWPQLAMALGVEALHISETDTQSIHNGSQDGVFANTWSVEGLIEEAHSSPCIAWGNHEAPFAGVHLRRDPVCSVGLFDGPAKHFLVRSWLPSCGPFTGSAMPHEETFSIAEIFRRGKYQPTVLFAYRPCPDARRALFSEDPESLTPRVAISEAASGVDELGVLVLRRNSRDVYWYGSTVDVDEARKLVPFSNATSLQVAAGVLAGVLWVLENPGRGMVAAEDMDHRQALEIAGPYLGELKGVFGTWQDAPENWELRNLRVGNS